MKPQIEITEWEWDKIEVYLDQNAVSEKGAMGREELAGIFDVERKIAHVKKVREEMEDSIRQIKIKEFHKHIPFEENESKTKIFRAAKTNPKVIWYAVAAAVAVSFAILWLMRDDSSAEKIFAAHFKPDIGLPLKMGPTHNLEFYEGMVAYKQENYPLAINLWQVLWNSNPQNDTLNYFLGVAHLAEGNAEKSLEFLKDQKLFEESIFQQDVAHYAALAKIKEGKFVEAKMLLQENPSERNTLILKELEKE